MAATARREVIGSTDGLAQAPDGETGPRATGPRAKDRGHTQDRGHRERAARPAAPAAPEAAAALEDGAGHLDEGVVKMARCQRGAPALDLGNYPVPGKSPPGSAGQRRPQGGTGGCTWTWTRTRSHLKLRHAGDGGGGTWQRRVVYLARRGGGGRGGAYRPRGFLVPAGGGECVLDACTAEAIRSIIACSRMLGRGSQQARVWLAGARSKHRGTRGGLAAVFTKALATRAGGGLCPLSVPSLAPGCKEVACGASARTCSSTSTSAGGGAGWWDEAGWRREKGYECAQASVGCGLLGHSEGDRALSVRGAEPWAWRGAVPGASPLAAAVASVAATC